MGEPQPQIAVQPETQIEASALPMMEQHADDVPRWWRRRRNIVLFVLFQPVSYLLGVGPAVMLHQSSPRPVQQVIEWVYGPLDYYSRQNWPGSELMDAYVDLFG